MGEAFVFGENSNIRVVLYRNLQMVVFRVRASDGECDDGECDVGWIICEFRIQCLSCLVSFLFVLDPTCRVSL